MSSRTDAPVVLITGAARRLGRAMALELARAGYALAVHHQRSSPNDLLDALRALNAPAASFEADVADEAACAALLPRVVAHFGRCDAVVNNAARFEYDDVATVSHDSLQRHWIVNVAPALILARALHAHVAGRDAQARGCVVNLLDQKLWNPNPDHIAYTLSKAALESATQLMARAYAPVLRVCGVAPGLTDTSDTITPEVLAQLQARTPLARGCTPQDVARAVRFMIESPAVTGTTLLVDAGSHLAPMARDFAFVPEVTGAPAQESRP
jgi:NAD(P)-dependent dehydrogenase (short-subunit alcohol dehydrogenase family)